LGVALQRAGGGKNRGYRNIKKSNPNQKKEIGKMKKLVLCLAILSLLAVPAMATDYSEGADAQAYGNMTADYQAGCVDQKTTFDGWKDVCDVSTVCKTANFDCMANVPNTPDCGLSLSNHNFESSFTKTNQCGDFCETVDGKFAVGMNAMTSEAGAAICVSPLLVGPNACASVSQCQDLHQESSIGSAGISWNGGISVPTCAASTCYNANQYVTVRAGN
jgi:hypothetical protein